MMSPYVMPGIKYVSKVFVNMPKNSGHVIAQDCSVRIYIKQSFFYFNKASIRKLNLRAGMYFTPVIMNGAIYLAETKDDKSGYKLFTSSDKKQTKYAIKAMALITYLTKYYHLKQNATAKIVPVSSTWNDKKMYEIVLPKLYYTLYEKINSPK